jgi:hypothetical protein
MDAVNTELVEHDFDVRNVKLQASIIGGLAQRAR